MWIAAGIAVIAFALFWLIVDLRKKWTRVFGKNAPPEGKLLEDVLQRGAKNEMLVGNIAKRLEPLERVSKISVQKVGFLRFNPFHDTGGDQSFSLALLDGENNGIIVSSLYTREGARIYAKEIKGGKAKQPLSGEEQKVLEDAVGK